MKPASKGRRGLGLQLGDKPRGLRFPPLGLAVGLPVRPRARTIRVDVSDRAAVAVHWARTPRRPAEQHHVEGVALEQERARVRACTPLASREEHVAKAGHVASRETLSCRVGGRDVGALEEGCTEALGCRVATQTTREPARKAGLNRRLGGATGHVESPSTSWQASYGATCDGATHRGVATRYPHPSGTWEPKDAARAESCHSCAVPCCVDTGGRRDRACRPMWTASGSWPCAWCVRPPWWTETRTQSGEGGSSGLTRTP